MTSLLYVTTNQIKIDKAEHNLNPLKIDVKPYHLDIPELQSYDGAQIAKQKAQYAYQQLQQPLLVNDDSWSIPALNGFPGPNMKQCNHFLRPEDWLRLMHGVDDRRIFLVSYYVFHDGTKLHLFKSKQERVFLENSLGEYPGVPHLSTIAKPESKQSLAQEYSNGNLQPEKDNEKFWQKIAQLVK